MRSRFLRRLRTCVFVGLAGLGVLALLLVGFGVWIGTESGNQWLARRVPTLSGLILSEGSLEVGDLAIDLGTGLRIRDLRFVTPAGKPVLQIGLLVADLDLGRSLWSFSIHVPHLRGEGVVVDLTTGPDGINDLSRMFGGGKPQEAPAPARPFSLPVTFDAPDVVLDGVHVRMSTPEGVSFQLAGVAARASIVGSSRADRIDIQDVVLGGQVVVPGPFPVTATGGVSYDDAGLGLSGLKAHAPYARVEADGIVVGDAMDLSANVVSLDLAHVLTPLTADTGLGGTYAGAATVRGPMSSLAIVAGLHGEGETVAAVVAQAVLDLDADVPVYAVVAELGETHIEHVYTKLAQPVVLGGVFHVDGKGFSFPDDLSLRATWRGGRQEAYGQVLDRVDLDVALADGVATIDHAGVDGIVGQIAAVGTVDVVRGPLAIDVTGRLKPERLAALGAEGLGTDGILEAKVTGDLKADVLAIGAQGTVTYTPFRYTENVTLQNLVAAFDAKIVGGDVRVGIDLDGDGIDAYGMTARTVWSHDLVVHVPAGGGTTEVDGTITTTDLAYSSAFAATTAETDLSVRAGDTLAVDAQVELGEHVIAERPGTSGTVTVGLRDDQVAFAVVLDDLGRTVLDTGGTFDTTAGQLVVDHVNLTPTPRIAFTDEGPWSMTLADGGVRDLVVGLTGTLGTIEASGNVSTTGASDARLKVRGLQLDIIAELYPDKASDMSGVLDLDVALAGTPKNPSVDAQVALTGLFVPETLRWLDARGAVHLEDGALTPDIELSVSGRPLARIDGTVPIEGGLESPDLAWDEDANLALVLLPGDLTRFQDLLPALAETDLPGGQVSASLDVTGPLSEPDLRLGGVVEVGVQNWTEPGRAEVVVERIADQLTVSADLRRGLASRAAIRGTATTRLGEVIAWATGRGPQPDLQDYDLWAHDMTLNVVLTGVPVDNLASAAGLPVSASGSLVGGFVITGSPTTPTFEGGINWLDPELGGQRLDGAYLSLLPTEGGYGYDLNVNLAFPRGALEVKGAVPIEVDLTTDPHTWEQGDLDLAMTGPSVPISFLSAFDPGIESATGTIALEGKVGGTMFDAHPSIELDSEGASLVYTPLNLRFPSIDVHVDADNTRINYTLDAQSEPASGFQPGDLAKASGLEGGTPRIRIEGSTGLAEWKPTDVAAKIELTGGAWLSADYAMKVRTNGKLDVSGSWPALDVTGNLALNRANVVVDLARLAGAAPLEPDPVLTIHRPGVAERAPPEPPAPPIYAGFHVKVGVDLGRNLELDMSMPFVDDFGQLGALLATMDLSARMGGQLDLTLENGEPSLVGEVEVIDGEVRVLNSQLDLERGTITFSGGSPSEDANLNLAASMDVETATLEMKITGTPVEPEIELSSPEYPDQAAQITMLLTGQAPDDLSGDTGAGALAGMLVGSVVGGLNLGSVSIEPDGSAKVTVPVSRKLRASSLVDPFPEPTENQYTVIGEWSISKSVLLVGSLGDVDSSIDLYWEYRF